MKLCRVNSKLLFGVFNVLFFLGGLALLACGFLLLCSPPRLLVSRLLAPGAALPQPPLHYAALALLAAGLLQCAGGALGCWATYAAGYVVLSAYLTIVLVSLAWQCGACVLVTVWPACVAAGGPALAAGGPRAALQLLQEAYGVPGHEQYTAALDLAQTLLSCCGMAGARDYELSAWQLRRLGPRELLVPLTCCAQAPAPLAYLDPRPYNTSLCQQYDADPDYRNSQGCLPRLEEWYHQHYVVFIAGMCALVLCEFGALLSTALSCSHLRARPPAPRPRDNYHAHTDTPLTAKYVQPNNFYSPRARNPHLFGGKPNDIA